MPRVLTTAEIERLRESGTEFHSQTEKRQVTLDGIDALVEQLQAIAQASQAIAQKRHDELVRAIESLKKLDRGVDFTAAIESLKTAIARPQERVAYVHEIERNQRDGLIKKITSVPEPHASTSSKLKH